MKQEDTAGPSVHRTGSLRVLHIGKYFPPHRGGMETFLRSLAAEQQKRGLEVTTLVHASERSLRSRQKTHAWRGLSLKVMRAARWATVAFVPISPTFGFVLSKTIRRENPDILHLHLPNFSAFWCLLLPSARRIPWVIQWQSDVVASRHKLVLRLLYSVYRVPERWMLKKAARIIVSTPPYLEASEPLTDFREKCTVVPLGVEDLEGVTIARPAASLEPGQELKVLAVGRLTYYKGYEYLLRALADTPDVRATLVGDGEEHARLSALAGDLGLNDRLSFLSGVDEAQLTELYRNHHVLCLPSIERTEAFGIVLLEAMRSARATIATRVEGSGMAWIVEHNRTGLLIEPENTAALSRALDTLRDDPDLVATMGEGGRTRFLEQFSMERVAIATSELYGAVAPS